ncbi:metal-dependent hydrolase [Halopiger aswanensis]|uniref:LexA-binding, inner membrane-associated putative hydrolase n=1 Tax=Halopiger aswanensis TaxID=148449 RepID=A0A3R7FYD1_9EURY|nr:metal-dependent hydrolase [Halopiger aswanensis]RKD98100.1 LexA-binding, inner membrane-associated putative hydrolase [Halopiger aswanensis]
MADLLSHVLAAYAIFTIGSWRLEWLTKRWVAVAMIGALLPDLNRIGLFVTDATLETVLDLPFSVDGIHTLGGVLVLAGVGSMVVTSQHRRAFGMLLGGALSHLLIDGVKAYADGAAGAWLYPFTWYRPPTPSLYISSDPAVLVVTAVAAGLVLLYDRFWVVDGRSLLT